MSSVRALKRSPRKIFRARRSVGLRVEPLENRCLLSNSVTEFQIPKPFSAPFDITSGPDGNMWFTQRTEIGRVAPTGAITLFALPPSDLAEATDITAGADNALWFTVLQTGQIGRITTDGNMTEFPSPVNPSGPITLGPDKNIWYTADGDLFRVTQDGAFTRFPLGLSRADPAAVVTGPDGNLWITIPFNNSVAKFVLGEGLVEFPTPTQGSQPTDITVGPDKNLWFTEPGADKIATIDPTSGKITEFDLPRTYSIPGKITAGADGALWFTEEFSYLVGRITTNGNATELPGASSERGIASSRDGKLWLTEFSDAKIATFDPQGYGLAGAGTPVSAFSNVGLNDVPVATISDSGFGRDPQHYTVAIDLGDDTPAGAGFAFGNEGNSVIRGSHVYATEGSLPMVVTVMNDDGRTFKLRTTASVVGSANPPSLTVSNTADHGPGSLRNAIFHANASAGDHTISFASGVTGTIDLLAALPDVNRNIDLEGPGPGKLILERSQAAFTPEFRIFHISTGVVATIAGLTVAGGRLSGYDRNTPGFEGAGIFNEGTLTIDDCTIRDNSDALDFGGGIANRGTLTVIASTLSGNSSGLPGGGIFTNGSATISDSTFTGNLGLSGGGLANEGRATVSNSTFVGNRANYTIDGGGAIYSFDMLEVRNSTITGNSAPSGGGILDTAGSVTLSNTIIAGNICAPLDDSPDLAIVHLNDLGHNLIGVLRGFLPAPGDIWGTLANPLDPRLGPLLDNGGPTMTQVPARGSPAIDAGDSAVPGLPAYDQRGKPFARLFGPAVDIGAVEVQVPPQAAADSQTAFVIALYRDVLGRAPDATGLACWVGALHHGAPSRMVVRGFWESPEHRSLQVDQLYTSLLHRAADTGGRIAWTQALLLGVPETEVARLFMQSPEYQATHATNAAFVSGLYADVLQRTGDLVGSVGWQSFLAAGGSRDSVEHAFLRSDEAFTDTVDRYYIAYTHQHPTLTSARAWVTQLRTNFIGFDQLAEALLASDS